jgi:hypothetical protein
MPYRTVKPENGITNTPPLGITFPITKVVRGNLGKRRTPVYELQRSPVYPVPDVSFDPRRWTWMRPSTEAREFDPN